MNSKRKKILAATMALTSIALGKTKINAALNSNAQIEKIFNITPLNLKKSGKSFAPVFGFLVGIFLLSLGGGLIYISQIKTIKIPATSRIQQK